MSDIVSVPPKFKMEMDICRESGSVGISDLYSGRDLISHFVRRFRVSKYESIIFVLEDDIVSESLILSDGDHCIFFFPLW